MSSDRTSLLHFPCEFIIKVMGKNSPSFESTVAKIFREQIPDLSEGAFALRPSKANNYLAMTVTFTATSQDQLDQLYAALSAADDVIMAL